MNAIEHQRAIAKVAGNDRGTPADSSLLVMYTDSYKQLDRFCQYWDVGAGIISKWK